MKLFLRLHRRIFFCSGNKPMLLLIDCGSYVYTFLSFLDAVHFRTTCRTYLREWQKHRTTIQAKEVHPKVSMVSVNTCMVCEKEGNMAQLYVPWSVMPPRAVFVYCANSYCKYHVLQGMKSTLRGFVPLVNCIFPPEIKIIRSSGKVVKGRGSTNYVLPRENAYMVHLYWIGNENIYTKWANIDTPYIKEQLLAPPRPFKYT